MRTFPSSHASSANTMHTVSLRFFPFTRTVSPRNSCNSSIFAGDNATTELSSFTASSVRQMSVSRRQIFFRVVSQTRCVVVFTPPLFAILMHPHKKRESQKKEVPLSLLWCVQATHEKPNTHTHTHMRKARYVDPFSIEGVLQRNTQKKRLFVFDDETKAARDVLTTRFKRRKARSMMMLFEIPMTIREDTKGRR